MTTTTPQHVEQDAEKAALIEDLRTARARGERPVAGWAADLRDADLSGADLSGADLEGADLRDANLTDANLTDANLVRANLRRADLWSADLVDANLRRAILVDANLRDVDLRRANLMMANLLRANLWSARLVGADLRGADLMVVNLYGSEGGIFQVTGLHPYQAIMVPTVDGWVLRVGCWKGTVQELRELIAQDDGWPEAEGEQIAARRPLLAALADLCDVHSANHKEDLDAVMKRWGNEKEN